MQNILQSTILHNPYHTNTNMTTPITNLRLCILLSIALITCFTYPAAESSVLYHGHTKMTKLEYEVMKVEDHIRCRDSTLFRAAQKGDIALVKQALSHTSFNVQDFVAHTPRHYQEKSRIIETLMHALAAIDAESLVMYDDPLNLFPRKVTKEEYDIWNAETKILHHGTLFDAAKKGDIELAKQALSQAYFNAHDFLEYTPRRYLAKSKILATVTKAIWELDAANNALFKAAYENDMDGVKGALQQHANVNITDGCRETSLHKTKDYDIAALLIAHKAHVNAKIWRSDKTPLHVHATNPDTIGLLIRNRANVNARDSDGWDPIQYFFGTYKRKTSEQFQKQYITLLQTFIRAGALISPNTVNRQYDDIKAVIEESQNQAPAHAQEDKEAALWWHQSTVGKMALKEVLPIERVSSLVEHYLVFYDVPEQSRMQKEEAEYYRSRVTVPRCVREQPSPSDASTREIYKKLDYIFINRALHKSLPIKEMGSLVQYYLTT